MLSRLAAPGRRARDTLAGSTLRFFTGAETRRGCLSQVHPAKFFQRSPTSLQTGATRSD